tara:strand:+ start:291 stop:884 length:594 start_codon:yes stop_codon:yes gene_type:complete
LIFSINKYLKVIPNKISKMSYVKQNDLLLKKLMYYYDKDDSLNKMLSIINGTSRISLRIVDWFATNYAKKNYTIYNIDDNKRFKVYVDYKLNLKAYSKKRFDPFCRWERITIPYEDDKFIQTTIGQLNFFKWALENKVIEYIENNYSEIENDMNSRNSGSKKNSSQQQKTRKKREELSISATKSIKRENIEIIVEFK